RDAEVLVEVLVRRARPECRHPDEGAIGADDLVPALPHGSLDRNLDLGHADNPLPLRGGTFAQKLEARHRYHARGNTALTQQLEGPTRNATPGAGRDQRHTPLLLRRYNFIGAGSATVRLLEPKPQLRHVLARERENARGMRVLKRELPALDGFDCIAWTEDVQVRNGAQRGEM